MPPAPAAAITANAIGSRTAARLAHAWATAPSTVVNAFMRREAAENLRVAEATRKYAELTAQARRAVLAAAPHLAPAEAAASAPAAAAAASSAAAASAMDESEGAGVMV